MPCRRAGVAVGGAASATGADHQGRHRHNLTAALLAEDLGLGSVDRVDVLPFHKLGAAKYEALGLPCLHPNSP